MALTNSTAAAKLNILTWTIANADIGDDEYLSCAYLLNDTNDMWLIGAWITFTSSGR